MLDIHQLMTLVQNHPILTFIIGFLITFVVWILVGDEEDGEYVAFGIIFSVFFPLTWTATALAATAWLIWTVVSGIKTKFKIFLAKGRA